MICKRLFIPLDEPLKTEKTMFRKLFVIIALGIALNSCSVYNTMRKANDNVKKVELGMTKERVISIMGEKNYRMSGLKENVHGLEERIWYPATQTSIFIFTFVDGQLVEWTEKFLNLEPEESKNK